MTKEEIVLYNKKFGIETIFSSDLKTKGMAEGKVIYLNDSYEDLEKANKHELLHFFENSEIFKIIKKEIIDSYCESIKLFEFLNLRKEYMNIYSELYSEFSNISDLIDTEIIIDLIIDNKFKLFDMEDKKFIDVFDVIVSNSEVKEIDKRYLNITLSKKIEQSYPYLSKWEKLFVLNNYNKGLPTGKDKYEIIREEISKQLKVLYAFGEDLSNFVIDYKDNEELEREFNGEIAALRANGDSIKAMQKERNKENLLKNKAKKLSLALQSEYKHIVDFIKTSEYDDAFKCLMLRETLTKVYRQEKVNDDSETIISKRNLHKSISGHMTMNKTVLDTIYNNLNKYNNFANLYYAGVAIYNDKISAKSSVSIKGVNTFNKGKWIKFNGKSSDPENYVINSQRLSSLVQDTPWCTKQLASTHLEQGDFYVFVDNDNKPRVAVKMNGNEIDEVRGLKGGNAQEIEEEYRDVVLDFLTKNKDIENGDKWLEKEEWNKRLIEWIKKMENEALKEEEIDSLLYDLYEYRDYKSHYSENSNRKNLKNKVKNSKFFVELLKKKYGCNEEDIYIGNICYNNNKDKVFPYKVVLGSLVCKSCKDIDMSKLEQVWGNFDLSGSENIKLSNLRKIGGDACFSKTKIANLDELKSIGGKADFSHCEIDSLKSLEYINGEVNFDNSRIRYISKLKYIGEGASFINSFIGDLSCLEIIDGYANFALSCIKNLSSLRLINGNANFSYADIVDLSSLEIINGYAVFSYSKIKNLSNLKIIKSSASFIYSEIEDLSNLRIIGGYAYFDNCKVKKLPMLVECGATDSINDELRKYIDKEFELVDEKYVRKVKNLRKM